MRPGTEDEVTGIVGVMREPPETARRKHLGVRECGMRVPNADIGGKVARKGTRKEVVAVDDAVVEVMKGERR